MKRKILVTGSGGVVGSYIKHFFPDDKLYLTTHKNFEVTNKGKVINYFNKYSPDIVIHLAAKTNVDECEKNKKEAFTTNALATGYIAKECKKQNSILVYVSTTAVFSGRKKLYTEVDKPNPVNYYGKTKLLGEEAIKKSGCKYIIIRAGWMIGGGKKENKFISYILQQMSGGVREINVVNDKFGSITYAKELVGIIRYLLDRGLTGIFHVSSLGYCSRYEIALQLKRLTKSKVKINKVGSDFFKDRFFAPRPKYETIQNNSLHKKLFRNWKTSLRDYITNEIVHA